MKPTQLGSHQGMAPSSSLSPQARPRISVLTGYHVMIIPFMYTLCNFQVRIVSNPVSSNTCNYFNNIVIELVYGMWHGISIPTHKVLINQGNQSFRVLSKATCGNSNSSHPVSHKTWTWFTCDRGNNGTHPGNACFQLFYFYCPKKCIISSSFPSINPITRLVS